MPKEHSHVARIKFLLPFFSEGSRELKLIQASLAIRGAEWNCRPFFQSGNRAYGPS